MKLYFMRHGQAAHHVSGTDADRPLTEVGRGDVAAVIDARRASLGDIKTMVTSPYTRARQTAEIVAERLDFSGQLLVCDELTSDSNFTMLAEYLNELNSSSVLLTTHQPLIGNVLSMLVGDRMLQGILPAQLVALEAEAVLPGFAQLRWLQMPGS